MNKLRGKYGVYILILTPLFTVHLAGSTSSCNSSTLNSGTLKRKGQAPAPPGGHSRNPSDSSIIFQGDAAQRPISLGDPPPLPLKEKIKGVRVLPPGKNVRMGCLVVAKRIFFIIL